MFEGSSLVDSLVEKLHHTFPTRESATQFLQGVLDGGFIKSIGRSQCFEDGAQLFYWTEKFQTSRENMADIANGKTRVTIVFFCIESCPCYVRI